MRRSKFRFCSAVHQAYRGPRASGLYSSPNPGIVPRDCEHGSVAACTPKMISKTSRKRVNRCHIQSVPYSPKSAGISRRIKPSPNSSVSLTSQVSPSRSGPVASAIILEIRHSRIIFVRCIDLRFTAYSDCSLPLEQYVADYICLT